MRGAGLAALSTALRGDDGQAGDQHTGRGGWPYPSLVQVAFDLDGTPLLLLSTLADHTKNIARDPRVGLLFDGTAGLAEPLSGPRLSVLGRAERSEEPRHRARFLARHPGAALYAGFADFSVYAVSVERAHLVAGFGRVRWLDRADLLLPGVPAALAEAEGAILGHMNADHVDALRLYATVLAGRSAEGAEPWAMTGIDPDGCDLRRSGEMARVDFDHSVENPEDARVTLAGLARQARQSALGSAPGAADDPVGSPVDSNDRDG
ncbi:HugZ family protein [Azospirillum argentinense]|uniref:HugZ family protein n=1 Tax=Azospirillum argentinense TaxID=2970906 RepID=A0ABW8VEX0_9PROT